MNFHEVRFPANLSFGSVGGPERRTEIVSLVNGFEERNTPWEHSRRRYDAGFGLRSLDDIETLISFFEARRGQMYAFRWKDWSDYKSCSPSRTSSCFDQELGVGDGKTTEFHLQKKYISGNQTYLRPIKKPVYGTVKISIAGDQVGESVDFVINDSNGGIMFLNAPAVGAKVCAGFEFDVPVRFDTDHILTSVSNFQTGDIPSVPIIEVRV